MSVPVATVAVNEPLPVPKAGLSVSHAALSLADQASVPPPVLLIVRVWLAGLPPLCWAVKYRLAGLMPMAGLVAAGLSVGATSCDSPVISDMSRPNCFEPVFGVEALPPEVEAVSPLLVDVLPPGAAVREPMNAVEVACVTLEVLFNGLINVVPSTVVGVVCSFAV